MKRISLFAFIIMMTALISTGQTKHDPNYFPIAVWLRSTSNAQAYKSNGINMYIGLWRALDQKQLSELKTANMKVICRPNTFGMANLQEASIYAWMHDDEPDNAQLNKVTKKYDPCIDPALIINGYEEIKKKDPSRPVYLNLSQGVAWQNWYGRGTCTGNTDMYKVANNGYLKGCDIASFDIYPVNNSDAETKDNLFYVAKGIDNLNMWSEGKKPVWCWIETTAIHPKSLRKPPPAEVKAEVWMALIHGAKGIGYFCHSFKEPQDEAALLHDKDMIAAIKVINTQITSLAGILNSPTTYLFASAASSNAATPVDIMTKRDKNAEYIFAVAMRKEGTKSTFTVLKGKKAEVLGENRTISIKNGKFSDDFDGYGVHLYKITN
ncbi:alpha-amylase family protein [Daejeonella lutea]|uniref:Glycoside hydrolase family 42 N-terminal domain-containing protein n=1 Tax=Daejeonella lutea TaxID=572036 RepID=A0A1T5ATD0_9SPHI|nr:hypothetical protein [Daejeonella lutea]SKB38040.1 hypothetical protein SAMN05661099_1002 [Daejeonella lutea]